MKFQSQVYTKASGSVGGLTYSHNAGGMYTRGRVTPTDPGSAQQLVVRGLIATLSNWWLAVVTEAQRGAWKLYAQNVVLYDSFGAAIKISGLAHYIRANVPRLQAGKTRIDAGPTPYDLGAFTPPTVTVDATADEVDVTFTNTDPWAMAVGGHMLVYASRPQNPSINFFKGPYRYAGAISGAAAPPTSPATIALPFPCTVGEKVFFQVRVSQVNGRLQLPFRVGGTAG